MFNRKGKKTEKEVKTKDVQIDEKKNPKFLTRLSILIASLKFLWFVGHVIVVYNTIINSTIAKFNSNFSSSYHKALMGSIISNTVILYKTHGIPDFASSWFENICKDENFHYLVISIIFIFTKPLFFLLYPLAIYSVFHIANFYYAESLSKKPESKMAIKVYDFINKYQNLAVKKIAQYEILIAFPMVFIAAICRQVTLLSVLIYGRFLYMRYYISPTVRSVWKEIQCFCENKIEGSSRDSSSKPTPKGVKYAYYGLQYVLEKFFYPLDLLTTEAKKEESTENVEDAEAKPDESSQPAEPQPVEVKN